MLIEDGGNIVLCRGSSADLLPFALGVRHAGLHSCPDDGQLQFRKHRAHLYKGLTHRVYIPVPAVYGNAAEDFQTQMLRLDDVDDFAELLGASAQTRDFAAYEGVA